MVNAISTLVGEELDEEDKGYRVTVVGNNGSLYGIPFYGHRDHWGYRDNPSRVTKFDPVDNSMTYIGPDFSAYSEWYRGTMTDDGVICSPPLNEECGILKIDTNTDTVTELDAILLPEQGFWNRRTSYATALDGCIYFMPYHAHRIMKLDPKNNDTMTSVRDNLGTRACGKYHGMVVGIDVCVYGIPDNSTTNRILRYDPINDITSFVGEEADEDLKCRRNGVLGRDGCIYVLDGDSRVLKIDTTNNSHCIVGNRVEVEVFVYAWGDAVLGIDGCIY